MWIWDANSGAVVGNNRRANKRGTSPGKDMWDGYSNPARVLNVLIAGMDKKIRVCLCCTTGLPALYLLFIPSI